MVLDAFAYKDAVIAAIGERTYKILFGSLRQTQLSDAAEKKMVVTKILDGQIMGKELPPSKTEKTPTSGTRVDPSLCQHPPHELRQGGNKSAKWFTCLDCTTRWERTPIPEQLDHPAASDLMLFGRYAAETYHKVITQYPNYTAWCRKTAEEAEFSKEPCSRQLSRFVQYLELARAVNATDSPFDHIPVPEDPGEFEEVPEQESWTIAASRHSRAMDLDS